MKNVGITLMLTIRNVSIVITTIVVLFLAALLLFGDRPGTPIPFDSTDWKEGGNTNERLRMVSDLKPKLMGIPKEEVERLLGAPNNDIGAPDGGEYYYLLGTVRPLLFGTDGVWLRIKFEKERVNQVQLWQD